MTTSSPSAQIGRYGTLSLMKRQEPSVALTAFGIDTPELTFGRDPSCGVRLYYAEVAVVHCRIVFDDDRKAFLCVLGDSGVVIDGCFVNGGGEMVPLMNGSEFEIRGKKFRFTYPPKEIRAALYASPLPTRRPRLSLITSTHVFSPRPSPDPRENLRILKSPLKNTFKAPNRGLTPLRTTLFANAASKYAYNSPVKPIPAPTPDDDSEEEEDDIVLVDGNHPRVVEDEKDLVILEDIDHPTPLSHPQQQMSLHAPHPRLPEQQPPKTPVRRRSQSLHRAVLIRSAQRAVLKAERDEREKEEEEMEEMEVLDVVAGLEGEDNDEEKKGHAREQEYEHEYEENVDMDVDMDVDMEEPLAGGSDDDSQEQEEIQKKEPKQKLSWRKSFERLWPFRSSSPTKDEEDTSDDEDEDLNGNDNDNENHIPAPTSSSPTDADTDEEDENEQPAPLFAPPRTPLRPQPQHNRTLGPFMTPQPRIGASVSDSTIQRTREQGLGTGIGGSGRFSLGGEARRVVAESQVWRVRDIVVPPPSPAVARNGVLASPTRPVASPRKVVVGDEERKAIQERRRSALREPSGLGFVPGFSPMKPSLVFPGAARPSSPTKSSAPPTLPALSTGEKEEEEEDTRKLLERMKETVEGMKRRRSEIPPAPVMPVHNTPFTPRRGRSPGKKGEVFSLLRTEAREAEDAENENEVVEVQRAKEIENQDDKSLMPIQNDGDVDVDVPMDADEEPAREKPRSRSKLKSPAPVAVENVEAGSTKPPKPRSRSKAKSPAPAAISNEVKDVPMDETRQKADEPEREPEVTVIPEPDAEPEKQQKPLSKSRSRSKSMLRAPAPSRRTTKVTPAPAPEPGESVEESKVRGRKPTSSPPVPEQEIQQAQPEPEPVKRGRKATVTTNTTPATATPPARPTSSSSVQDEPAPTRRGRKPTVEPEEAPKRGRKLGVTTAATKEAEIPKRGLRKTPAPTATPVVENAKGKEPVKRGRTPRAGSAVPVSKAETQAAEAEEEKKVTIKGRRRAGTIKKDDDAESASGESVNAPAVAAVTTKARTPAVGTTRTRKTPASASAVPMQEVNKENEHGEEEVKVRVSRKGRAKKDVSTQEDDEVDVEAGVKEKGVKEAVKGRVGRVTRARTRT